MGIPLCSRNCMKIPYTRWIFTRMISPLYISMNQKSLFKFSVAWTWKVARECNFHKSNTWTELFPEIYPHLNCRLAGMTLMKTINISNSIKYASLEMILDTRVFFCGLYLAFELPLIKSDMHVPLIDVFPHTHIQHTE